MKFKNTLAFLFLMIVSSTASAGLITGSYSVEVAGLDDDTFWNFDIGDSFDIFFTYDNTDTRINSYFSGGTILCNENDLDPDTCDSVLQSNTVFISTILNLDFSIAQSSIFSLGNLTPDIPAHFINFESSIIDSVDGTTMIANVDSLFFASFSGRTEIAYFARDDIGNEVFRSAVLTPTSFTLSTPPTVDVPEPSSLAIFSAALLGLLRLRKRT